MFFKELACLYCLVINVHLCCLLLFLFVCVSQQLNHTIMSFKPCQQLFSTFFDSFSLFQRRPLKLTVFAVLLLSFATALLDYHMIFCLSTCFLNYFLCFFNSIRKPQYLDMDWSLLTQFLLHVLQKVQTDFA